jgi:hypothetical protein
MGAVAAWQDEERSIILQIYTETWTWDDLYDACRHSAAMMRTVDGRVDVIADFTHSGAIPIGGGILHARNVMSAYPGNWGVVVVVTTNRLMLLLVSTFVNAFPKGLGRKTFVSPTVNEALKIIDGLRAPPEVFLDDEDETKP